MTDGVERLHPTLVHHVLNTLGWPSLRPLQSAAVTPILDGLDALLLAPTAGGKTEAACFPLLSKMETDRWRGTSVLYVCPLKALLNNLLPRLERYADWLGRRVALWHGDVSTGRRRAIQRDRPDILLTTPESLDAMLVSTKLDHREFFADLRAVVVDEAHAFAGDDRGWHLLAVLERLGRVAGRPIQRVGLSATVGNPDELLTWLQGSGAGRESAVLSPMDTATKLSEIELDYVGSIENAATVIAKLHRGEKRLVFCDSRRLVEQLAAALRSRDVTTFLSHASLSTDERRQAEQAFTESRDCVIVATSTLELGVDVGDLDRVIQINAPSTVASFLQRLGRTGRRAGNSRNCLFLALDKPSLLRAAGLLLLWADGWVERLVPPPEPRHIVAQQLLALCLQEGQVGRHTWADVFDGLGSSWSRDAVAIADHLASEGFLSSDGGMLFVGPEAEARYGRRHFMELTAVFTTVPEFTVMHGREEIGRTDPALLAEQVEGPRLLLLGGRTWKVTHRDWARRRCFVEAADDLAGGKARWSSGGVVGLSYEMSRSSRRVLLGDDPPVTLTSRATAALAELRDDAAGTVNDGATVIRRDGTDVRWWTWAGYRANATLAATLPAILDPDRRPTDHYLCFQPDMSTDDWRRAKDGMTQLSLPRVDEKALNGLKFSDALLEAAAVSTLAARLGDPEHAASVLAEDTKFWSS